MSKKNILEILLCLTFLLIALPVLIAQEYTDNTYGSGTYGTASCGDGFCTPNESCSTCSADCGACNGAPTNGGDNGGGNGGGGGGGGGGGATSATPSVTESQTAEEITPLQSIIFTGFNPDLRIKQVEVKVTNEVQNAGLVISKYDSRPELIPVEKPGLVYRYLEFQEINIGDSLDKAIITFFVDRDWVDGNELEATDVSFFRFNEGINSWNELPTTYNSSDDDYYYYYYEAESDEFGFFAIGENTRSILQSKFGSTTLFLIVGGVVILGIILLIIIRIIQKKKEAGVGFTNQ
jgi:PGF-pre-PGF domain-containing protein